MKKRVKVFLEFLIGGILLGIIEDLILINLASNEPVTWHILWIVLVVTLPFAFLGEYVVDRIDFLKIFNLNKSYRKKEVFFEFLIFGIILGVVEDLIAFYFAVGDPITLKVVLIAAIVAIPFAFLGEYVIDRMDLRKNKNIFQSKKILK
mgnify:CR=1 FL=1